MNDVVCPEGDSWRDEINSVAVYMILGTWVGSGVMVNNTANDLTPYFLTAWHCGITNRNDSTLVVYWNYESPRCGQLSGGSLLMAQGIMLLITHEELIALSETGQIPDRGGRPPSRG